MMIRMLKDGIKKPISWTLKRIAPKFYIQRTINQLKGSKHEPELKLLEYLCNPNKMSLDIGASMGLYSFHMIDFSDFVMAFEARPKQARSLRSMLETVKQKSKYC